MVDQTPKRDGFVHAGIGVASTGTATHAESGAASRRPTTDFRFSDPHQVHIWSMELDVSAFELEQFKMVLSRNELERAARFRFDRHRIRYIVAHGWLREVLALYLSATPSALEFEIGPKGKPFLSGSAKSRGLQFNLAHSESLALLAISGQSRVGVDVERVRTLPDAEDLVARFFSNREAAEFRELSAEQRPEAFFNLWTRKEAWLKATGEGIADLLAQVEVSFLPAEPARLLGLPEPYDGRANWSLGNMIPTKGFVGAVAVESEEVRPLLRPWNAVVKEGLV